MLSKQPQSWSAQNLTASSEACTEWRGMPALLIEVVDDPDPVQVGETTTYTVRVTNQGTAEDTNVGITANFSKEITPVTAEGGTISGQTVKFAPVPCFAAKQSFTYKITGRGAVAGDSRLKVEMTADLLKTPVTEEERTHVY